MARYALVGFLLAVAVPNAFAQSPLEKAQLARTAWSAFQCGTYAEMSGDKKEQERLFILGVVSARNFIEALQSKQIPAEVFSAEVPLGVSLVLQGPSTDFMVGRVFENAMRDAFELHCEPRIREQGGDQAG